MECQLNQLIELVCIELYCCIDKEFLFWLSKIAENLKEGFLVYYSKMLGELVTRILVYVLI